MATGVKFDKACEIGIAPDARIERNYGAFEDVQGLLATEYKLKPLPPIEYQLGTPSHATVRGDGFPFPNIHDLKTNLLLFRKTSVFEMDDSVYPVTASALSVYTTDDPTGSALSNITDTGAQAWHCAGGWAPDTWVATNSKRIIFRAPRNASNRVLAVGADSGGTFTASVTCESVCRYNNMIAFFGLDGDWLDGAEFQECLSVWKNQAPGNDYRERLTTSKLESFNKSWVIAFPGDDKGIPFVAGLAMLGFYGAQGYDDLREYIHFALKAGRIIILPMRETGDVLHGRQIGQRIACYGTKALCYIDFTEGGQPFERMGISSGIKNRDAAGGDKERNLYMSKSGRIHEIPANGPEIDLGRDQIFAGDLLGDWLVCYDHVLGYFSLHCAGDGGSNGPRCYWRTRTGLTRCDQVRPTALYRPRTDRVEVPQLYGAWYVGSQALRILTPLFDGGTREVWELAQVNIAAIDTNGVGDGLQVNVIRRTKKGTALATNNRGPFDVDNRGQAYPNSTCTECQVEIIADDPSLIGDGIDYIELIPGTGKPTLEDLLS